MTSIKYVFPFELSIQYVPAKSKPITRLLLLFSTRQVGGPLLHSMTDESDNAAWGKISNKSMVWAEVFAPSPQVKSEPNKARG